MTRRKADTKSRRRIAVLKRSNVQTACPERRQGFKRSSASGQILLIVAIMMTVLVLFLGLGIDVGNLMGKRAKLQSAVDSATLSAAQVLFTSATLTQTAQSATNIAFQVLEANGVPSPTLSTKLVSFPGDHQVRVKAVQDVPTFFMRIIPLWRTVPVSAEATADLSSFAEMTTKPYGSAGVVTELNMMVWGPSSWRRGGDAFSPLYGANGGYDVNDLHNDQPYGYLYRIDVPPSYPFNHVLVELFDPDTYNRPGTPPPWPTAAPPVGSNTPTHTATSTPAPDQYASCTNPRLGTCTSNQPSHDVGLKLNAFASERPAFWRVDEIRTPYTDTGGIYGTYNSGYATTTQFTLWHFNPRITSAFADPATLSDQSGGGYLARYTSGWNSTTDLAWYRPSGFDIQLTDIWGNDQFDREINGGFYFYLYVEGIAGSSENNFDIRVGPPDLNGGGCPAPTGNCYVNQQYMNGATDWKDGGASIFAKQSLPLNLITGQSFPLMFTQISRYAGGQLLGVRHFDQDCSGNCGNTMNYQMQICGCFSYTDPTCWVSVGTGYFGPNNGWAASGGGSFPDGYPDPEIIQIPYEGTTLYNDLFGATGQCSSSWLRIERNPSYSGDTTVWQMPYFRARLIK